MFNFSVIKFPFSLVNIFRAKYFVSQEDVKLKNDFIIKAANNSTDKQSHISTIFLILENRKDYEYKKKYLSLEI